MGRQLGYAVLALAVLGLAGAASAADPGKGNILVEEWYSPNQEVTNDLDTLKAYSEFPDNPDYSTWLQAFDRPDGGEDYWGGRFRGYLYPPQTGDYTFWTCSDDDSELWLSTDEDPANTTMIASVEGWMPYLNWDGTGGAPGGNFQSGPISLEAGKRYYVEALWSDGTGGGFLTVGWGGPGIGAGPVIIDGKYLAPVMRDPEPMFLAQNPDPADGTIGVTAPLLGWTKGASALWSDVYFGTDREAVENATVDSPEYIGRQMYEIYWHVPGLEPGATYYWRIDSVEADGVTTHKGPVWSFTGEPLKAYGPDPADGASGLLPGLVLTWGPGKGATEHQVYFGTDEIAVAASDASVDQGTVDVTEFNPGALRSSTTYFWRIDSIKQDAIEAGDVWSFTTVDAGPANKILYETWQGIGGDNLSALLNHPDYPDNPTTGAYVDLFQSPVDWADNYGQRLWGWLKPPQTGDYTFWIAGDNQQRLLLSTDSSPANVEAIASVSGWTTAFAWDDNPSQMSAPIPLEAGKKYFIMALGKEGGGGDSTAVAWQGPGIDTREVIKGEYVDMFALPPLQAFGPEPANGAVDTAQELVLEWGAGAEAQQHEVYFGDDADAIAAADTSSPLFMGRQAGTTFDAGSLEWGKTYFWRVDEINDGNPESPWKGPVWSFTTANFVPVDDFESYTDDIEAGEAIWQTWIDGLTNLTGSIVGYFDAANGTFCETAIVHGGSQSMPFDYNNIVSPYYSELELPLDPAQDWTVEGVSDLSLWVRGYPAPVAVEVTETAGKMSLTGDGRDIWDNYDEFTYAYKTLNGNGSIVARVVSNGTGSNAWAKGGVMIRDSLDGGSTHAMMVMTGGDGNGASFQWRPVADGGSSNSDAVTPVAPPYWVMIERIGDGLTGYMSFDGQNWSLLGSTQFITMSAPVYIGICVTSHAAGEDRTFEFDNIQTTGGVSGAWQGAIISAPRHNASQNLYVFVEEGARKSPIAVNPDAVNSADWVEWKIPLSTFDNVNLARISRLYIGVGDRDNPTPDGAGLIFIDDIRVAKPEPEPAE